MSTNAPDHPTVEAHSSYFEPGSEALENMADVVTGQYSDDRAAPPRVPRDRRGTGGLGPADAGGAGVQWPDGTTGAPASGSW